ncbi:DUF998 domain-containing protein [Actinoplanes xinjiangensis]|uniref:DUF998 domain-containing protein n=1 Tax=Actinoplanes xinjiangensis TaxID=512350 RepID=UPI0034482D29
MDGMTRVLPAFGALAAGQMLVVSTVDGLLRPGYDPMRNWISHLSLGEHGWIGTVNLATCGLWLVLGAVGLYRRADRWAAGTVLWCGLCLVALAVVRTDAGLGFPPGVPVEQTVRGLIHQMISVTLAVAGIAAVAQLGPRRPALLVAGAVTVLFTAATVLVLLDAADVVPGTPSGLLERIALFAGLGWIGVFSVRAASGSSGRRRRAAPPTGGAGRARTPGAARETAEVEPGW